MEVFSALTAMSTITITKWKSQKSILKMKKGQNKHKWQNTTDYTLINWLWQYVTFTVCIQTFSHIKILFVHNPNLHSTLKINIISGSAGTYRSCVCTHTHTHTQIHTHRYTHTRTHAHTHTHFPFTYMYTQCIVVIT